MLHFFKIFLLLLTFFCSWTLLSAQPCNEGTYDDPARWIGAVQGSYSNDITVVDDATAECGQAIRIQLNTEVSGEFSAGFRTPLPSGIPDVGGVAYTMSLRYRSENPVNENLAIIVKSRNVQTGDQRKDYAFRRVVPTNDYQALSVTFTSDAPDETNNITIQVANGDDTTAIFFDNIEVDYTLPETDCTEGEFNALTAWSPSSAIAAATVVTDSTAACDNAFEIVPEAVQADWFNATFRIKPENSLDDEVGERYRVSFKYRATADARLAVNLTSNNRADGSQLGAYQFDFLDATTDYKNFATTFTSIATDSATAYLSVVIGVGLTDETVYIDDVVVEKIAQTRTEPTTVYVNPAIGSDDNDGLSNTATGAWKTIAYALTAILPGDSLLLADGLYVEGPLTLEGVVATAEQPTVIKSINEWGAKLQGNFKFGAILEIKDSEHVVVDGIEAFNPDTGDDVQRNVGVRSFGSDYVTIQNVFAHDCGCAGISAREGDYFTIQDNIVRDNAKISPFNCSGISIFQPIQKDDLAGYHIIIRRNVAFENECRIPFTPRGFDKPTDGNGIILDDFYQTQSEGVSPFEAASLVENNLTFNNGGNGIKVYKAERVTVRNNTAWHNNYVLSEGGSFWGEITIQSVYKQTDIVNNVLVQKFGQPGHGFTSFNVEDNMTLAYQNNLIVGSTRIDDPSFSAESGNKVVSVDRQSFPQFGEATTEVIFNDIDDFKAYFGLRATSPGIDAGLDEKAATTGRNGTARPQGVASDIGAYEGAVDGVGPLPKDQLLVAGILSAAVPIQVDGRKEGFYTGIPQRPSRVLINELDNEDDLATEWTAVWDEDNLYVHATVEDDVTGNGNADALSVFVDGNNDKGETYDADDRQFTLNYDGTVSADFTGSILPTATGYTAEMAIPWSLIGITPSDSLRIGLDLIVSDDDNADGTVDHQLAWQAGRAGAETNPSLFGEGLLLAVAPPPFIAATQEAVTVDGTAESSWDAVEVYAVAKQIQPTVTNAADLSAQWRAQWDEQNLYFFISVTDDDKQNDSPDWFNDDGVEIYLDADNSKDGDYGSNDYQIIVEYQGVDIYDTKNNLGPGATAQVVDTDSGYDVEVALPWTALKATPESGLFLGLDVHVIDDDEGGNLSGKLAWFADVDNSFRNTTLFGSAVLAPESEQGKVLPGRIEAETYREQAGITVAPSGDDDTDAVVDIWYRDFLDYEVNVQEAGLYRFTYRVARGRGGLIAFRLQQDNQTLHYGKLLKQSAIDQWIEIEAYAYLEEGAQTLRIQSIGRQWKLNWFSAEAVDTSLPGQLEAEAFAESKGYIPVLPSGDTDETSAITFLKKGASVSYPVEVSQAGIYLFTYRVRTVRNQASFRLQRGDETLHTVKVKRLKKNPFGWQEVMATAELAAGSQRLMLVGQQTGGSINWWRAELADSINATARTASSTKKHLASEPDASLVVYPNPTQGTVQLLLPTAESVQVNVYDFHGRAVRTYRYTDARHSTLNLQGLPEGLYLIRARVNGQEFQKRVVLEK